MKRRLFSESPWEEADVRPTLLGVVTLAFLLLFFLLGTSTGARLAVLDLVEREAGEDAAGADLPHPGPVRDVVLALGDDGSAELRFAVQSTDIAAASTSTEQRRLLVPPRAGAFDAAGAEAAVLRVHALDGAQRRATLVPAMRTDTATLLAALDLLRGPTAAPRFPDVGLRDDAGAPPPGSPPPGVTP